VREIFSEIDGSRASFIARRISNWKIRPSRNICKGMAHSGFAQQLEVITNRSSKLRIFYRMKIRRGKSGEICRSIEGGGRECECYLSQLFVSIT